MARYIELDALVAEIERLKDNAHNGVSYHQSRQNVGLNNELSTWEHLESAFATILNILDTLEVKEVDLDLDTDFGVCWGEYCNCGGNINDYKVAKHFFELGLKAQKL